MAQTLADPTSTVPTLGASGAIAAVMGAFLITFPRDRIRTVLIIFLFVTVTVVPAARAEDNKGQVTASVIRILRCYSSIADFD